ncbi:hypothetical protein GCM10023205_83830 [Yinghuangia aomiensis]|uniref:DUF4241 domain-containing protein n=1 Tax=Yinghuangia aomiensis TaxID=676205 RepID=A0ABP9II88_9ACTN
MPLSAPDFDQIFVDGASFEGPWGSVTVDLVDAGLLRLSSGRLVAGDPFGVLCFPEEAKPFTATLPVGNHRVLIAALRPKPKADDAGRRRRGLPVASMILFEDTPVARWDMALTRDLDLSGLSDQEFYGFGVDAGTAAYFDLDGLSELTIDLDVMDHDDSELFEALMDTSGMGPVQLTTPGGHTIVAFRSGPGDGTYPTWIGYAHDGRPARVATCFEILRHVRRTG